MPKETKIQPLGDRVLVRETEERAREEKTKSGIIIPATVSGDAGGNAKRGLVVAVGSGKLDDNGKRVPMQLKKGDIVLFQWGDEVVIGGEKHFLVREDSVLAIVS